jgi:hypothetical protein
VTVIGVRLRRVGRAGTTGSTPTSRSTCINATTPAKLESGLDPGTTGTIVTTVTTPIIFASEILRTIGTPVLTGIIGHIGALAHPSPTTGTDGNYLIFDIVGIVGLIDTIDTNGAVAA